MSAKEHTIGRFERHVGGEFGKSWFISLLCNVNLYFIVVYGSRLIN